MKEHTRKLMAKILLNLKPPPDLTLSQWADEYRRLSSEASAESGRWKTDRAPYQREIMDAITNIAVKKVVVMSAAQVGKTDAMILNPIGYYMHYDPAPIMVLQPTIQMSEAFSKDRLSPMIRDTPAIADKVKEKGRNNGNTILQKTFPGGHVTMVGANSPAGLRSRPIRILLADEIDAYPATAGGEGDPLFLAGKRLTTFWNKKEVDVSTPTTRGLSRIEVEFENSTQGVWNVPCPACGEMQELEWGRIVFDKNNLDEISHVCIKCGTISSEVEWKEKYIDGKFIEKYPEREVKGFHLNTLASTFADWKEVVEKFLKANEEAKKGNIELLKAWTNTEMGQTWEEEGEQVEEDELLKRREKYNCEVPEEVIALTAGIDTQDDRFEIEVVGWGEEKESWGIKFAAIYGDLKQEQVWKDLDEFIGQTFQRADGAKLKIICACMDSGGHFTNEVYKFCKARTARRIFAIKGKGGASVPYVSKPTTSNRYKAPLFTLGVDTGKSLLLERLKVEEEGGGYCHFPKEADRGYNEDYFKGLTAEKQIMTFKKGRACFEWKIKDSAHKRNEALDCRNYATAALEIAQVPLKKKKAKEDVEQRVQQKKGRRSRSKGGVV